VIFTVIGLGDMDIKPVIIKTFKPVALKPQPVAITNNDLMTYLNGNKCF